MSRPVLPALAVLFLGWSTAAVAAETPPDEDTLSANQDVQAKKKKGKKRAAPVASGAPKVVGQQTHSAQKVAQRRHAASRNGGAAAARSGTRQGTQAARPATRSGGKQGGQATRPANTAQRSQAQAPRTRDPAASGAHRPDMRGAKLPGRSGSAGGPVRRGAEQPGARSLPQSGPRVQDRPDRSPHPHREAPARGDGESWHGAGGSGGGTNAGSASRGQRSTPGEGRGQRASAGERDGQGQGAERGQAAERGPRTRAGDKPRTQAPGAASRVPGERPRVVRVERSKYVPERWAPDYHRRGLDHLPKYHPQYWASGVFLYSPPSHHHSVTVIEQGGGTQTIEKHADKPLRAVDRSGSFAIGLRGGSYMGRGVDGERHADNGVGVAARFRPVEALGVEVAWSRHLDTWEADASRTTDPLSVSGQIFAFPWTRVSPYLSAGYTWTNRSEGLQGTSDKVKGPHAGLGLELAIGDSAAIGVEGRYTHYGQLENISTNFQRAGALQGTLGMNFYF